MLRFAALFSLAFSLVGLAIAQTPRPDGSIVGVSSQIDFEVKETTAEIMARAPIFERRPEESVFEVHNEFRLQPNLPQNPASPAVSQWPPAPQNFLAETLKHQRGGSASRGRGGPYSPQTISTNWLACDANDAALVPPDAQIGVGPTEILLVVNGRIRVFNKTGVMGSLNTTTDNFFQSVRGPDFVGDSRVRYDSMASRWVITTSTFTSPNRLIFCYSDGPTISNATVWTMSFFVQDAVGITPNADTGLLADYQTLGVDEDGIIIGANMFDLSYEGSSIWVLRKSDVYDGAPYTVTPFREITVWEGEGIVSPQPVTNYEVGMTTSYVIGTDLSMFGRLVMRRLTNVDSPNPVLGPNTFITTPATSDPEDFDVLGSNYPPDTVDSRLIEAEIRLNRITGTRSLWTCHQIEVNAAGVANTSGNRNGTRWYELANLNNEPPSLVQAGTLWDPAAANPNHFWMSSINANGQGHMAIAPTAAGETRRLEIVAAGRLRTDPLGATQAPTNVVTTAFNYPDVYRWGDYAAVRVDPTDDQTMWAAQMYCSANNIWGIRIAKLMAPPPGNPISAGYAVVGTTSSIVVNCSTSTGELFDTAPGMNRLSAVVNGGGVTVNSVTFNSIDKMTMNITVAPGAATGLRSITVTNPDGQTAISGSILNIISTYPVPTLTSLSPSAGTAGGSAFTLTCNGTNFSPATVIRWNGSDRPTTFVSPTQVTANISAADISFAAVFSVTAFNPTPGGGSSNAINFSVSNPTPSITSISPTSASAGGPAFTLTVTGTNFNGSSFVRWNGVNRTTTFVNSTTLTAAIPATDIANTGSASITVFNPIPGGGLSGAITFTIGNPAPTLTALSPTNVLAGSGGLTLTCTGTGFTTSSVVRWNGANRTTTFVNSTTLQATIPSTDTATASSASITVQNPSPGGGTSNALGFAVNNPLPVLASISPPTAIAGGSSFTITCTGSSFVSSSVVRWNGLNRPTTFVNSTTLTATINASDIAVAGLASVTVFNPAPGGGTSVNQVFSILNPIPILSSISPSSVDVWGPSFTITCTGSNFVPQSVVKIGGSNRPTTFVNSTTVTADISASDIIVFGPKSIMVFNPAPGGANSTQRTLTVNPRVISGTVNLIGYADPTNVPIVLRFRPAGDVPGSELLTTTVNLNPSGTFSVDTSLPPTIYDVYADGSIWLQRRLANVNLTGIDISGLTWDLPAGDIDGDGAITPSDYGIWAINNGSFVTPGEFGDLDGDGAVTPSDYGIWAENNGLFDDE